MGEYALEHPAPDTDLEDCAYAQFERELRADPHYRAWLEQLAASAATTKETNDGDQRI